MLFTESGMDVQLKDRQYERLNLSVIQKMNTLLKMRYENSLGKSVQRKVVKPDILIGVDYYWNLTE